MKEGRPKPKFSDPVVHSFIYLFKKYLLLCIPYTGCWRKHDREGTNLDFLGIFSVQPEVGTSSQAAHQQEEATRSGMARGASFRSTGWVLSFPSACCHCPMAAEQAFLPEV